MHDLEQSIIRILNPQGATVGPGFVVADSLAMTCGNLVTEGLLILAVRMTDAQYIKMEGKSSYMYSEQIIVVIGLFP